MKKFLTVLLALSVVFTYTVGSAFAAAGVTVKAADTKYTLAEVETAIYARAQENVKMLDAVKANYLANYNVGNANKAAIDDYTFSKAAVEKEINTIFNDIAAAINKVADDQKTEAVKQSQSTGSEATYKAYDGVYKEGLFIDEGKTAVTKDNSFDSQTANNESDFGQLTAPVYKIEGETITKVDAFEIGITTYYTKKTGVTWYELDKAAIPAFPGYFIEAEKTAFEQAVTDEYMKYDTIDEVNYFIETALASDNTTKKYEKPLLTAEHAIQKAEVVALIDKVNAANYSDNIPSDADQNSGYYLTANEASALGLSGEGYYSYQAQVKAIVETAIAELAKSDILTSDKASDIKTKINTIKDEDAFYNTNVGDKIKDIPTIQQEGWDKEDLATMISRITVAMKSYVTEQKSVEQDALNKVIRDLERKIASGETLTTAEKKQLADAKEDLAALDSEYAAIEKAFEAKINAYDMTKAKTFFEAATGTIKDDVVKAEFKVNSENKKLAAAQVAKVEELQQEADLYNQMVGVNGQPMYDKDEVAKALEVAVKKVYAATTVAAVNAVELEVAPIQDPVKDEMNYVINGDSNGKVELNNKFYAAIDNWATTGYDDAKTETVKSIIEDTKAAVRAAKTIEAVDEAFLAGYTKYDAVPTKADRDSAQAKKAYTDAVADYKTELKILINVKAERYGSSFETDFGISADDLLDKLVGTAADDDGLYAAYTVEEMKTIYDEAVNTVNNLKSKAVLDAEVTALNAEIAAVKVPVTADAKETILALNKKVADFVEYAKRINYNTAALRTALLETLTDAIKAIDTEEIREAVKVLMKDGKITLNEKAAVEAVVALVDAYVENYDDKSIIAGDVKHVYEFNFIDLEVKEVENMIAKIDPTATPLDIAAIKAAREAYNALGEAKIKSDLYQKLLSLENLVEEYVISSTEGLKLSVSTKLYKKSNKIRVNWKVKDGDASYIDGYQVYKSTKAQKNYKYMGKTKKSYMDNKKNLKKGTRYYYKVRAYVEIDGQKYYSDWSNKGNRIYK